MVNDESKSGRKEAMYAGMPSYMMRKGAKKLSEGEGGEEVVLRGRGKGGEKRRRGW